jgi:hypothetical protein
MKTVGVMYEDCTQFETSLSRTASSALMIRTTVHSDTAARAGPPGRGVETVLGREADTLVGNRAKIHVVDAC